MPPESLSTTAVMKPGPRTARNIRMCRLRRASSSIMGGSRLPSLRRGSLVPQNGDHVVSGDHARQGSIFGENRQCKQVVFVKEFRHAVLLLLGTSKYQAIPGQFFQGRRPIGQE